MASGVCRDIILSEDYWPTLETLENMEWPLKPICQNSQSIPFCISTLILSSFVSVLHPLFLLLLHSSHPPSTFLPFASGKPRSAFGTILRSNGLYPILHILCLSSGIYLNRLVCFRLSYLLHFSNIRHDVSRSLLLKIKTDRQRPCSRLVSYLRNSRIRFHFLAYMAL